MKSYAIKYALTLKEHSQQLFQHQLLIELIFIAKTVNYTLFNDDGVHATWYS